MGQSTDCLQTFDYGITSDSVSVRKIMLGTDIKTITSIFDIDIKVINSLHIFLIFTLIII